MGAIFTPLVILPIDKINGVDDFDIEVNDLELRLRRLNHGISLDNVPEEVHNLVELNTLVPHYHQGGSCRKRDKRKIIKTVNKFPEITGPCSSYIESWQELADQVSFVYQVSHAHYMLAKAKKMGSFPNFCCGRSSRSVSLSLIENGFPNASYAYNDTFDHGYVILPFVFPEKEITGCILNDPTSDQLGRKPGTRNATFLKFGTDWKYGTSWERGRNLFPEVIASLDVYRKIPDKITNMRAYHSADSFFEQAFSNPIKIML